MGINNMENVTSLVNKIAANMSQILAIKHKIETGQTLSKDEQTKLLQGSITTINDKASIIDIFSNRPQKAYSTVLFQE